MAGILDTYDPVKVYSKATWSGTWVERAVVPKNISRNLAGKGFSKFEFEYNYGNVKLQNETAVSLKTKLDITNHYVQVRIKGTTGTDYEEVDANIFWQGRVATKTTKIHGKPSGAPVSGIQTFTAYDGLYVLYKVMLSDARFEVGHDVTNSFVFKNKLPPINLEGSSGDLRSNRSRNADASGLYAYEGNKLDPDAPLWNNLAYLEYTLSRFDNVDDPEFAVTGETSELEKIERHYKLPQAIRISDLCKMLINPADGFDFAMTPTTNAGSRAGWELEVFNVNRTTISTSTSTDSEDLTGSTLSVDIDIVSEPRVEVTIEESYDEYYNEVRSEGDRVVCCSTLEKTSGTPDLIEGWASAEAIGYAADGDNERQNSDYSDVFCRYVFDPQRPTTKFDVEIDDSDSSVDLTATTNNLDLLHIETLDWIPVDDGDPATTSLGASKGAKFSDKRPIKVVMQDLSPFEILEDITKVSGIAVQSLQGKLGFRARPQIPHELTTDYGYSGTETNESSYPSIYDPAKIYATVAFKHDVRPRIVTKANASLPISDGVYVYQNQAVQLWVHRQAQLDVDPATQNTMLAAKNEEIRNDTDTLIPLHNGRRARYNVARGRATMTYQGLALWHVNTIGYLIRAINDGAGLSDVYAIVSSINWSFDERGVTTVLKAGYGN